MDRLIFFVFIVLMGGFLSCKEEPKIDISMSDDRMTELIIDMHYLEGIIKKIPKVKKDSVQNALKEKIIEFYDFKSIEDLDSLLSKAQQYPDYFKKIQNSASSILDSLEKSMNTSYNKKKDIEKKKLDKKK